MTTTINASTSSGLVNTADTSGIIKVQSNGVTTNALAWVNFYWTGSAVSIKASYNVSSVTRVVAGVYTIAYTNNLTDSNYCWVCNIYTGNAIFAGVNASYTTMSTSQTQIAFWNYQASLADPTDTRGVGFVVFGN